MKNNITTNLTSLAINPKEENAIDNHINGAGGFYLAQLTTEQRDQVSARNGLMIYNITTRRIEFYQDDAWRYFNFAFDDTIFDPENANKVLLLNEDGTKITVGRTKEKIRN